MTSIGQLTVLYNKPAHHLGQTAVQFWTVSIASGQSISAMVLLSVHALRSLHVRLSHTPSITPNAHATPTQRLMCFMDAPFKSQRILTHAGSSFWLRRRCLEGLHQSAAFRI
jgi:hypothetical protein